MKRYRMKLLPGFVQAAGIVAEVTNQMDEHQSGEWCRYEEARDLEADAQRWRDLQAEEAELAAEMETGGINAAFEKILDEQAEEQRLLRDLEGATCAVLDPEDEAAMERAGARMASAVRALREFRARQKGGAA